MQAGRPVIASRTGGLQEVVLDGETGLLVPVDDVDALAAAMLQLVRDPELAMRMGQAATKRAHALFDWDACLAGYEAVIQEAARAMTLPNFYLIGAAKSGTTALTTVLSRHPQFSLPEKEPDYASGWDPKDFAGPQARYPRQRRLQHHTLEAYLRLYEKSGGAKVICDAFHWFAHV